VHFCSTPTWQLCATRGPVLLQFSQILIPPFVEATEALEHAHLRPQRDYLVDGADLLIVPNLLCTEVLGQDFEQFCFQHGIKAQLPWVNRSCQLIPYEQHYCPSSWQRIGERYSADVALWELLNE